MAQPTTFAGRYLGVYLETSPGSGNYAKPCGSTNHTVTFSKNLNEVTVPDCDNPDLPAWVARETESLSCEGSAEGILAAEALAAWQAAYISTDSVSARIYLGAVTDAANGKYWVGKIHISSLQFSGDRGTKVNCSINFVSDGELVFTDIT
jgi:hypothetical protein